MKEPISAIELPALQLLMKRSKRLHPHQITEHDGRMRVMRPVYEVSVCVIRGRLFKSFEKPFQPLRVESAYGKLQAAIMVLAVLIEVLVIGDHPREDGILIEVIISPSGVFIDFHDILEIGELALLPALGEAPLLESLYRILHASDVGKLRKHPEDGLLILKYVKQICFVSVRE